ncbi:outer membrane beta-barrel protein [Flavihumibacter profundi]|uniref:outer membrane beta-barrel protein n=1 Tax=Flavihumibacter profundi TaxID=2716883 RepID=UPI001CC7F0AB|nr:outer membrane beta-barrel protein [Flavihumibacter profundi]MBZ5856122.1 porin family protein [Flavihumibacter profundi]
MSKNNLYCISWIVLLQFIHVPSMAQDKSGIEAEGKRGIYSLNVFAGGGVSFYLANPGTPSDVKSQVSRIHPTGTLRVMWYPDHLLKVGLETGITNFYSYKIQDSISGNVVVQAVPLLLVFSMPITKRINIFAGPGGYFITSKLDYEGQTKSKTFSVGWMAAGSYEYPINDKVGLAGEIKLLNAFETKDVSMSLQIQLRWKFMEW